MTKQIIGLLFLLNITAASFATDTLHVVTHNRTTVVTDPSKGENNYRSWGVFPSSKTAVRKIVMHVKFGCPDTMRCADWDYMDRISILRKGGVNGAVQNFEIGRMLTPYGGAFGKQWNFEWEVDVTDFSLLLRDSVEIEYKHTGWEPNKDRGWAITISFDIIKGKPSAEPVAIQKIYDGMYNYGDSSKPITTSLAPFLFKTNKETSFARLRIVQTGHGMDEPDGCSEFCNKYREIFYDNKLIDKRNRWKKCGDNPLYPQAGTWLTDRANWCPGNLMIPDVFDLPALAGKEHTIAIKMQDYKATKPSATEAITAYLIEYKKIRTQNDVAIDDIVVPSSKNIYLRQNPASANAQVIVKNMGANEISSMLIQYGSTGFAKKIFNWKGSLLPGKSQTINLPEEIDMNQTNNIFTVQLVKPDNKKDGYAADNILSVPFVKGPVHDSLLVFYLRTNNEPEQNAYRLLNSKNEIIEERKLGTLKANTEYRDSFHLVPGAYQLALVDTAGDGLEFWYNTKGGRGMARLLDGKGNMIKTFESDCGSGWVYNFNVGQKTDDINSGEISIGLFPTRTNDKTTLDYFGNKAEDVLVKLVTDPDGKVVEEHRYTQLKEGLFTYDLSRYPKGRFYLKVIVNGVEKFNKRVRLKE